MVLFASGRCDIVAFYTNWFMKRYEEGFVDVRNPFYPKNVSRIYFEDVDLIMFCTKNPNPILPYLHKIKQPILFHVTLTPYKKDIEPNVIDKKEIIEGIKKLSTIIPSEHIYVRYDPIFISETYSVEYHIRAFKRMCELLDGYVRHIVISFVDEYKNVHKHKNELNFLETNHSDYLKLAKEFSKIAHTHMMSIQTCCENIDVEGIKQQDCLSKELAYMLTSKKFKRWNGRGKLCNCVEMADIGAYNSCSHYCKYCYANFDEKQIRNNMRNHDKNSSLLIGSLKDDDVIKVRK